MLLVCLCSRASRAKLCCCWSPSVNVSLTTGLAPNFSLVSFFHSFCVYLTRIWPVRCTADTFLFSPFDRFLTHLLQPPFICVFHHLFLIFLLLTPNTKHPSNLSRTPPSCFLFVGSPTTVHGPPALSPSSCPLPCLCFEAVCSGSTSGRVRRKRAGLVVCMPVLDVDQEEELVVCLLGCAVRVGLYVPCMGLLTRFKGSSYRHGIDC